MRFNCERCNQSFPKRYNLQRHLKRKIPCEDITNKIETLVKNIINTNSVTNKMTDTNTNTNKMTDINNNNDTDTNTDTNTNTNKMKNNNTKIIELLGKKEEIYKKLYDGILNIDNDTNFIVAFDKMFFTKYEKLDKKQTQNKQYLNKIKQNNNLKLNNQNKLECVCGQQHLTYLHIFKHQTQPYSYIIGSTCIIKIIEIINLIEERRTIYELELMESKLTNRIEIMKIKELRKKELEKITEIKERFEVMKDIIKATKQKNCINCTNKLPNKSKFYLQKIICKECCESKNSDIDCVINIKCNQCNYKNITINLEKETDFNDELYNKIDKKCCICLKKEQFIKNNNYYCKCKNCNEKFENIDFKPKKPKFCNDTCKNIYKNKKNGIYNLICEICKEKYTNKRNFKTTKCYACYSDHIHNTDKIYLKIPFNRKYEGKEFGTKWDQNEKSWYIFDDNEHKDKLLEMFS
jgi:hypothetical protein